MQAHGMAMEEAVLGADRDASESRMVELLEFVRSVPEDVWAPLSACCEAARAPVVVQTGGSGAHNVTVPGGALAAMLRGDGTMLTTFTVSVRSHRSNVSEAAARAAGMQLPANGTSEHEDLPDSAHCVDGWDQAGYTVTILADANADVTTPDASAVLAWPSGTPQNRTVESPVHAALRRGERAKLCVVRCEEVDTGRVLPAFGAVGDQGELYVTCASAAGLSDDGMAELRGRRIQTTANSGESAVAVYVSAMHVEQSSWEGTSSAAVSAQMARLGTPSPTPGPQGGEDDSKSSNSNSGVNVTIIAGAAAGTVCIASALMIVRRRKRAKATARPQPMPSNTEADEQLPTVHNPLRH
jgi:hypothetical protein